MSAHAAERRPLLIAYGNRLRGDDGAAHLVAERVAQRWPACDVVQCHQLVPELVEAVTAAAYVLFVDAALPTVAAPPGALRLQRIAAGDAPAAVTHFLAPQTLLALAEQLYGRCPPADWLLISGAQFDTPDQLSPALASAVATAVELALQKLACA